MVQDIELHIAKLYCICTSIRLFVSPEKSSVAAVHRTPCVNNTNV